MLWDKPPRLPRYFDRLQEYDPNARTAYRFKDAGPAGRMMKFRSKLSPIVWMKHIKQRRAYMKVLAAALVAVFLYGCAGTKDFQKALLVACNGYTEALTSLATYRALGRLTPSQIATVDRLRPSLNTACKSDVTDARAALATVEAGLLQMLLIKEEVK